MEHIVNIAFDFDDAKVKKHIEDTVEKQIIDGIKKDIEYALTANVYRGNDVRTGMRELACAEINKYIESNKDAIFDEVCKRLEQRIARTKGYKAMAERSK